MMAPDMATIIESLERSMRNCSLSNRERRVGGEEEDEEESSISDDNINAMTEEHIPISDRTLELGSHVSLPCHWEQCLDLKTGEIYYINWKNGEKVKEDPRRVMSTECNNGESYTEEEEDSSYDSEESWSDESSKEEEEEEEVLVVAGCKACFMYFMVPKLVDDCPKCASLLIHFDHPRSSVSP
ncbi:PREDICTED: uncharacterized protein LOC104812600 [Tarenaya hassleriana]|uniref:uncharacterized protein LOC104812600 n=1 Tax=Tarenaya hassleriana TaxID=28532 RepID=UPI00053C62F4|nr:PREDICTED: uncharacterized protein LOC104812600 [Tarenaya hassleriana]